LQKAWLSQNGIEFTERNIAEDKKALEELVELGVYSTPATMIDGEVIIGFNRQRLEELLLSSE
jgi:arsenate reductase-like glutaredoxin family protein